MLFETRHSLHPTTANTHLHRFKGCNCTTQCKTNRCPCLLYKRECDPDICRGCARTADGGAHAGAECCNMNIRLRRRKRVVMSLSTTHGKLCCVCALGLGGLVMLARLPGPAASLASCDDAPL